jgi:hypothetical protein
VIRHNVVFFALGPCDGKSIEDTPAINLNFLAETRSTLTSEPPVAQPQGADQRACAKT